MATAQFTFELVTLDGVKFSEECYEVLVPTPLGQIAVLPQHAQLVSLVSPGVVSVRRRSTDNDDAMEHLATAGGMIEILGNHIRLLADEAQVADDINELEAKEALARAKELVKTAKGRVAQADATALIERYTGQLRLAELKKRTKKRY